MLADSYVSAYTFIWIRKAARQCHRRVDVFSASPHHTRHSPNGSDASGLNPRSLSSEWQSTLESSSCRKGAVEVYDLVVRYIRANAPVSAAMVASFVSSDNLPFAQNPHLIVFNVQDAICMTGPGRGAVTPQVRCARLKCRPIRSFPIPLRCSFRFS